MNKIIVLCLITLSLAIYNGPAYNPKYPDSEKLCSEHYIYDYLDDDHDHFYWADENPDTSEKPNSESDCVDLLLWDETENKYYDRCCYVRFQIDGEMHAGCVGLHQEILNDSTETIKRMERGDRARWTRLGEGSKSYQLDCNSSFLKYFYLASLLLCLLL